MLSRDQLGLVAAIETDAETRGWCASPTDADAPWSWTPPAEPGPEVRRVRPVERYAGDNGIWYDREPDSSGWRLVMMGRVGGVIEWLQVIAGAGSIYGGRQLIDATAASSTPETVEATR